MSRRRGFGAAKGYRLRRGRRHRRYGNSRGGIRM
jgi:hypothetical protein